MRIWIEKIKCRANAASVFRLVIPEIDADVIGEFGERDEPLEIHNAVAPAFCPGEFKRLAAVRLDLARDAFCFRGLDDVFCKVIFADK